MLIRKLTRPLAPAAVLLLVLSEAVLAHAAEQGFILLLPTDIYITAGAATVMASILLISLVPADLSSRLISPIGERTKSRQTKPLLSLFSTAFLFLILWIGVTGPTDPLGNILPLTIWVGWWICFTCILPFSGNLWSHLNPWSGLSAFLMSATNEQRKLPDYFGVWPAVAIFVIFNGFAVADIAPNDPNRLALFVGGYWCFIFCGTLIFNPRDWLDRVECFTVFFRLIASLSPYKKGQLGFPGWATLKTKNPRMSHAAFCIVMLGSGSFDGLHETFWWLAQIGINPLEFPGRSAVIVTSWAGLLATNIALAAAFAGVVWIGKALASQSDVRFTKALPLFALSLIPIAFGYHVAHYLTSFLVGIQYLAISLSDPFATGANWIGLSDIQVTTGFLNDPTSVKFIWLTQAAAVVISHVIAVVMAHCVAARLYSSRRNILLSQSALSLLMIGYTIFGLWLLASPRGV